MSYKAIKFDELYEDLMEHQKNLAEKKARKLTVSGNDKGRLNSLFAAGKMKVDRDFKWDNDSTVTILNGWDKIAGRIMQKGGKVLSIGSMVSENIKHVLDSMIDGTDDPIKPVMKRKGKLVTMTYKVGEGTTSEELTKRYKEALKGDMDKIKHIGTEKDGKGFRVEIEMK
jgi:hypothetical protein